MLALIATGMVAWCVSAGSAPPDDEAVALARALLMHDEGISSIEWSAEALMKRPNGEWEMFQNAEHGMDELGRWYMHARVGSRMEPDQALTFSRDDRWTSDGIVQTWSQDGGAVTQWVDYMPFGYPNVALFLGRMCAWDTQQKLGDLLLAGEDLHVVTPEDERGVVRISATNRATPLDRDFIVDVDTRHGFMPVRIEVVERMRAYTMEVMEITAIEQVNGVYVPTAGNRWTYFADAPPADQTAKLEEALLKAGVDLKRPALDTPQGTEKYRKAVLEVFGAKGFTSQMMESGEQRMGNVKVLSVNTRIADEKFTPVLPANVQPADVRWDEPMVLIQGKDGGLELERAADHRDMDFHVAPRAVTLRGFCGEPAPGELRVLGIDAARVRVRAAECTTPGLVIDKVVTSPVNESEQRVRFVGMRNEPGAWTGTLKLTMQSAVQRIVEAPVTMRLLSAWRAEPVGVVLDGKGKTTTVKLVKRTERAPTPVSVQFSKAIDGVSVALTPEGELRVTATGAPPARATSAVARVLGKDGEVCADVPVVWWVGR